MKKKLLSILIVLVMVLSTLPAQVFATETGNENTDIPVVTGDPTPSDVPVPAEPAPAGEPDLLTAAPSAERVCEEGCILEGEEEHLENDGECLVWIPCTATEGCEGPDGHEGECYGAALYAGELPIHFFLASPGNITNPNGSYINYYGPSGSANNWDGAWTIPNIKQNMNPG